MKKHLFIAAAAVVALASCTTSEETFQGIDFAQEEAQNNAIQFGTYLGKQQLTRAGKTGSLNTDGLKAADAGFGVFAYYTNTADYTYSTLKTDGTNGQTTVKPNFMYNQKVEWNSLLGDEYITKWSYSPLKYWPNNISTTDVDDQNNDTNSDPANASENGGKISFFAYAPYVKTASGTDGITAMTANTEASDPIITYVVPSTGNSVDLLWGTYGETSINVNGGSTNAGVAYNGSGSEYAKSILPGYKVNADLTKQKTNGKVDFAFKHALAKVGGSEENSSSVTNVHGLMVVLDVDDMKGAEKGGSFNNAETKVTITSVNIVAKSFVDGDDDHVGDNGEYLTKLEGKLNLANGRWQITGTKGNSSEAATETHLINSNGSSAQGTLNSNIAEPTSAPAKTEAGWNGLPNGVLTTPQNVYASEAAPLVFIPGTHPELTITVVYTVRTKDANLADAYSEVVQTITKKVTFTKAVELNKQYSLLMHLGLTGVKFTASVSDWQVAGDENNNGVIDGSETLDIQDVFVPINVAAYSVVLSAPATLKNDVVASSASNVTISPSGIRYYDYAAGAFTTHADATVGDYTFTKDGDFITLTINEASFSNNTTTRKRVGTVTVAYNGADVNGVSKDVMEPAVLTFTQAAGALQIADPTGLTATELSTAAKVVDLVVKDAGGNNIDLTNASNAATITVPTGWSFVKTSTGIKVTVPKNTTAADYTVSVKVNDTAVKEVTFKVNS